MLGEFDALSPAVTLDAMNADARFQITYRNLVAETTRKDRTNRSARLPCYFGNTMTHGTAGFGRPIQR